VQNIQIANNIKQLCKDKGISITELQKQCGLSKSFIYDLEKRAASPSCQKISNVADYLGCSVDFLLGRTDDPNLYIKTRYELIKNMSIQDMAAAIAEIASDCRYCGDGCSDCDGGCLSCIEDKLQAKSSI